MKLAFSKPEQFPFEARASFQDGTLHVGWNDSFVILTEDFVRSFIGAKELSDATNIYILTDNRGNFVALRSKMTQTYLTKQSGFEYAKQNQLVVVGQIYIPFADTPFNEWVLRLNFQPQQDLPAEFSSAEEVGSTLQEFHNFAYKNFPSLRIVSQVDANGGKKILVQLTKEGVDVAKPGVRVFAKSSSGYLAKTESYTDANGQASFIAIPMGLDASDKMTPEFGFKWVTNLARVDVAA
jgi:hypothetical protein